ncbi:MAG: transglycosylase domain-containing protein [bacterium]|nr:transglycosylase domain-containing protein [bacterium]
MKKLLLLILLSGFLTFLVVGGWLFLAVSSLPQVDFLSNPGVSLQVNFPDWRGRYHPYTVGPENPDWVPLSNIPQNLRNAVLSGEDFSFYSHKGVDWFELRESFLKDLQERRFSRGASTITQQLAKNLFLSRDKTVKRKVSELVLARRMEKALTKDRILELYLNVVELGDMVYGVGPGTRHHFGKQLSGLSLRECTFLAAMLPGPKVYDPERNMDRVMNRSDHILGVMLKGRMITDDQYLAALVEIPFAGEPSELVDTEQDPGSAMDIPPEIEEDSITNEDQIIVTPEEGVENGEVFTTQDGIVEIPIR